MEGNVPWSKCPGRGHSSLHVYTCPTTKIKKGLFSGMDENHKNQALGLKDLNESKEKGCFSLICLNLTLLGVYFRPVARGAGVRCTPPNLAKCPLLATKWAKNGVLVGGLRWVKFTF